jgi:NAD(P)-dependent dehydrogenase (short-subunit alcohol dehydrogenase family)
MSPRRAIVVGSGHHGFPLDLAAGLQDAGWEPHVVLDDERPRGAAGVGEAGGAVAPVTDRSALTEVFGAIERRSGAVDLVVHAFVPPGMLQVRPFGSIDDATWAEIVDRSLHAALAVAQAAHGTLRRAGGGSLVVTTPALSLTGGIGLSALATAAEGVRVLARSAARSWAADRITVNCLAVSLEALAGGPVDGFEADRHFLGAAALGRTGDARHEIAPIVALLGSEPAAFITGATLPADGGLTMAP